MPIDELSTVHVLVADDDPSICELLSEFCRDRGLRVTTAVDGRAAVTALERSTGEFRLVFADIAMPEADGFAVLRAARAANAQAYVVIITGYASLDSAIQAVRVGANDYLTKPFALGQIEVILAQVRERFALEHGRARLARESKIDDRLAMLDQRLERMEAALDRLETRLAKMSNPQ